MPCPTIALHTGQRDIAAASFDRPEVPRRAPRSRIHCRIRFGSEASRLIPGYRFLERAAADLVAFHAHEQRAEIAGAEALVAPAVDDLEEDRPDQRLREDLQQVAAARTVDQDSAPLQLLDRHVMARQALLKHLV